LSVDCQFFDYKWPGYILTLVVGFVQYVQPLHRMVIMIERGFTKSKMSGITEEALLNFH